MSLREKTDYTSIPEEIIDFTKPKYHHIPEEDIINTLDLNNPKNHTKSEMKELLDSVKSVEPGEENPKFRPFLKDKFSYEEYGNFTLPKRERTLDEIKQEYRNPDDDDEVKE